MIEKETETARALLASLSRRKTPSRALARVQRYLGETEASMATFRAAAERLRDRAEAREQGGGGFAVTGALLLDAASCLLQARDSPAADSLLRRCATEFAALSTHEQRRLPILAAMAADRRLVEQVSWALPAESLGARLVSAWLRGSASEFRSCAVELRRAAAAPPIGPVDPWADSDIWEQVWWAEAEAQRS